MTIWIDNQTDINFEYDNTLKDVVTACIEEENYPNNIEVSIVLVDNNEIQKLNYQFRNNDKVTDVLSFPMTENELDDKNNINLDTNEIVLGDIIISLPKAIEQANEFEHSLKRELSFLTAHSMFHLMGYDHQALEAESNMKQKQNKVLSKLGIER